MIGSKRKCHHQQNRRETDEPTAIQRRKQTRQISGNHAFLPVKINPTVSNQQTGKSQSRNITQAQNFRAFQIEILRNQNQKCPDEINRKSKNNSQNKRIFNRLQSPLRSHNLAERPPGKLTVNIKRLHQNAPQRINHKSNSKPNNGN